MKLTCVGGPCDGQSFDTNAIMGQVLDLWGDGKFLVQYLRTERHLLMAPSTIAMWNTLNDHQAAVLRSMDWRQEPDKQIEP